MSNPFGDADMAAGYAASRPPVHPRVVALLSEWMECRSVCVAVDVGCGAGLSTRPLLDLAHSCIGFDPAETMVHAARRVVPQATFVAAGGEAMPLRRSSVDLLAAAGSLNYAQDLKAVWKEALRVLRPEGTFAVYDFSAARSFADRTDGALDMWFDAFEERYPKPMSQAIALSPALLAERAQGFDVTRGEAFELALELTPEFYVAYMLTETSVQQATRAGTPLEKVRDWCTTTLAPVFGGRPRSVLFRGYLATLRPRRR
jgi:SAM-dependent methyltransferase